MSVLVLGLGNLLMSDDSVGVRAIQRLQSEYQVPEGVTLLDGGTLGLDLLPYIELADTLLIIDALEMQAPPGSLFRLEGDEVPRAFANKLSVHQMGLQDLLAVAELQGYVPQKLVVHGIQAGSIEMKLALSSPVEQAMESLNNAVIDELASWGITLKRAA
ncbi:MAG: HyaD/HybD family hydrogenase maturation endopeptidase [Desulfuromonadales bacterium]|nr:HyaD/HybD family hydrogenase maturation endopeptidase [Desulfuromonadales bacterium]